MLEFILAHLPETLYGTALTLLGFGFKLLHSKMKSFTKQNSALKGGVVAILRNDIMQIYNIYASKGYIPIHALESVLGMYTEYQALGGNGTVTALVEELKDMTHKNPKGGDQYAEN